MVWKSREGKLPPPQFLADLAAYLERAHGTKPSRELMEKLYPFFVEEWRNGSTSRETANATCACKKGEIVPSPATSVRLSKGEVKPPRGAKRGDIFGADALRTPGAQPPAPPKPPRTPPPTRAKRTQTTLPRRAVAAPSVRKPEPAPPAPPVAPPVPPVAPPAPTPSNEGAVLLGAIKDMLPDLKNQLAAEMAKAKNK